VPDDQTTSWRTIVYGTAVFSSDNVRAGDVREVLGSDSEDIFHGLRVRLTDAKRDVMVAADDVEDQSSNAVHTSLTMAEIDAAPAYDETKTYHLASVGWLRKHMGWRRDSQSDEEPG
jgi:hypothetical protein